MLDNIKKRILITLLLIINTVVVYGQNNKQQATQPLEKIIDILHKLDKTTTINNFKHTNQKVAYKDGLWIESDRFGIWFINYKDGVKHGKFYFYNISTNKKEAEGTYEKGVLIDSLKTYDANGNIYQIYKNIKFKTNTLTLTLEIPEKDDSLSFNKVDIVFSYEANYERYNVDGKIYKTGVGVFNDNKTYSIQENKGFSQELNLFRIYDLKK